MADAAADRITLRACDDSAAFDLRWGGRLASLVAGGAERLLTSPPSPDDPIAPLLWGAYLMTPWVGRVRGATLDWRGRTIPLRQNFEGGHSIHGVVYDKRVEIIESDDTILVTECALDWELGGSARQEAHLGAGALVMSVAVTAGAEAIPVLAGWHPLFRRPDEGDVAVRLDARRRLEVDPENIPTGRVLDAAGDEDLSGGPRLGARRLDNVFVEAVPPAVVRWPDLRLEIGWDAPIDSVVVYTPGFCFCVEPQSGWPDAVRLRHAGRTGLVELEPGETARFTTRWNWIEAP